ncbi:MAG TPA: ABC transporter permease [Pseudothermotoga sp.]|uniref:ABC transporter permease n=1 Tax=Thermotoga profunda TaxID=1508420 RepID=UPI001E2D1E5C|nr:ABC transporter permease [Thermotoga profunda]
MTQKILFFLIALWTALTLNFLIPRLMPGDPAERIMSRIAGEASPSAVEALRIAIGIEKDKSLIVQYLEYIKNSFTGNFGISYVYYPVLVRDVLKSSLPWTIGLVGISTAISFLIGTWLGAIAGYKRDKPVGVALTMVSLMIKAFPYFWLSMMFLYLFGYVLKWFPLSNAYSTKEFLSGWSFVLSVVYHAILPGTTLVVGSIGSWILTMRNNIVSVLAEDYILLAEAKGLSQQEILANYAMKNAILPSVTAFGLSLGFVVSGALLTEIVFSYPGVGYQLYRAAVSQDYPLIQAIFFFISLSVLSANLLMDFVYMFLDPRTRG